MWVPKLAFRDPGTDALVAWSYPMRLPSGLLPPPQPETALTPEQRGDMGLLDVTQDAVPAGKVATAWTLTEIEGAVHRVPTLEDIPLSTLAAQKSAAVTARRDQIIGAGVAVDFGAAGTHVLQTATEYDRQNWLTILTAAQAFAAMGAGDEPMNPIRTADNVMIPVTVNQAIGLMLAMQTKLGAVWLYAATLKDQIAAAEDQAALDAIDPDAGWPDPVT